MMLTLFVASVIALAIAAPALGVDTRRPEMLRTRGAGIIR